MPLRDTMHSCIHISSKDSEFFSIYGLIHCVDKALFQSQKKEKNPCKMETNLWHIFVFPETKSHKCLSLDIEKH